MVYELAHKVKEHLPFVWNAIEWCNDIIFTLTHSKKLSKLPNILKEYSGEYTFRMASIKDINALVYFFANQPETAFEFFNPHSFDGKSISKTIKSKAFLTFVVTKGSTIVGYFFLRCYINDKCFRGKMVDKDWQGRGIAKQMGIVMTKVSQTLGLRMYGSISPDNFASLASAKASNGINILKILDNGYYYIEFLPKETDNQVIRGGV